MECKSCKERKSSDEMIKSKNTKNGYGSYCKECMKVKSINQRLKNPIKRMFDNTKSSAKKRGIFFNLKESDIILPKKCPYTNFELTLTAGIGLLKTAATIDRIDNLKGYTKDNIIVISHCANRIKGEFSIIELVEFSKNTLKMHNI